MVVCIIYNGMKEHINQTSLYFTEDERKIQQVNRFVCKDLVYVVVRWSSINTPG